MALFTVAQVAERLKLGQSTIRAALRSGAIPGVRLGRRVRIAEDVLSALEKIGHPTLTKQQTAD
jgi:excisionase family DNA binding protein